MSRLISRRKAYDDDPIMLSFLIVGSLVTITAVASLAIPLVRDRQNPASLATGTLIAVIIPVTISLIYINTSDYWWQVSSGGNLATELRLPADPAILEQHLQDRPSDTEAWLLLGDTYFQLRHLKSAEHAFRQVLMLTDGNHVEALLGLAVIQIQQGSDALVGEAGDLVEAVLDKEPDNIKALWYGGLSAFGRDQPDIARQRWRHLLQLSPPAALRQMTERRLAILDLGRQPQVNGLDEEASESPADKRE